MDIPPKLDQPKPMRTLFEESKISKQNHFYSAKTWLEFCKERDTKLKEQKYFDFI
jgi:hypothetical protein